ncbi:Ig-like domain-containing protein [Bacillus stercoris]|nr:Ig-like domain-containing protein [Bacillus stercoris]
MRATEGDSVSDWVSVQFLVETPVVINPPNPGDGGNGGGDDGDGGDDGNGDIFEFDVSNTFPSRDQVDITPEKVIIIFSDAVDGDTVNSDSIYIVKREDKKSMNILDFMTLYSPSKQIKSTIEPIETPNIITITAEFEDDAEYTVIVRETVKSKNGSALGVAYHWAFMTHFTYLYGDPQSVRDDIGSASDSYSDKSLYKYMRDISNYAYEVVSGNADFSASDYADGKAPYYVHQYVRFKTGYDLLINSQLRSVADGDVGGIHQYKLGDLTITKDAVGSGAAADMSTLLDELKTKMKVWEDLLHGQHNRGYAKPTYVVPGENSTDTYPDFFDRSEFKDLGE